MLPVGLLRLHSTQAIRTLLVEWERLLMEGSRTRCKPLPEGGAAKPSDEVSSCRIKEMQALSSLGQTGTDLSQDHLAIILH